MQIDKEHSVETIRYNIAQEKQNSFEEAYTDAGRILKHHNSEPHRKAMQKLPFWCDEASYVHWTEEEYKPVDWQTIHLKMIGEEGKITKVIKPSARQLTKNYPTPKWTKLERTFKAH